VDTTDDDLNAREHASGTAAELAARSNSFGAAADLYERARPSYPVEAARWLLEGVPPAATVVDLGAGTGKFTRVLLELGRTVVAVEPSGGMRETLARVLPQVEVLEGSGESMPIRDRSIGAVLSAQAWHWVDESIAIPEVARVLEPGGTLGMLWNQRDESADWVRRLGELLGDADVAGRSRRKGVGGVFGDADFASFPWEQPMTPDGLVDLVLTRSYVLIADEDRRERLLDQVRELAATHPDLAGRSEFALPYVTECWRHRLPTDSIR
jgi:SAM-dependent methyltransferase